MQAGREIRVMVLPDAVDDIQAQVIARDIAKQVEEELTYPGQIRGHGRPRVPRHRGRPLTPARPSADAADRQARPVVRPTAAGGWPRAGGTPGGVEAEDWP